MASFKNGNLGFQIEKFDPGACSWNMFVKRLKNKFLLYDTPPKKQVLALLDCVSFEVFEQLCDLYQPQEPETMTFDELANVLGILFRSGTNIFVERGKFHGRVQRENETFRDYANDLEKLAQRCKFPSNWFHEGLITQFIIGIRSEEVRSILCQTKFEIFEDLVNFATKFETAELNVSQRDNETSPSINNQTATETVQLENVAEDNNEIPQPIMCGISSEEVNSAETYISSEQQRNPENLKAKFPLMQPKLRLKQYKYQKMINNITVNQQNAEKASISPLNIISPVSPVVNLQAADTNETPTETVEKRPTPVPSVKKRKERAKHDETDRIPISVRDRKEVRVQPTNSTNLVIINESERAEQLESFGGSSEVELIDSAPTPVNGELIEDNHGKVFKLLIPNVTHEKQIFLTDYSNATSNQTFETKKIQSADVNEIQSETVKMKPKSINLLKRKQRKAKKADIDETSYETVKKKSKSVPWEQKLETRVKCNGIFRVPISCDRKSIFCRDRKTNFCRDRKTVRFEQPNAISLITVQESKKPELRVPSGESRQIEPTDAESEIILPTQENDQRIEDDCDEEFELSIPYVAHEIQTVTSGVNSENLEKNDISIPFPVHQSDIDEDHVWQGSLKWTDKTDLGRSSTKQLRCTIMNEAKENASKLAISKWPKILQMELRPATQSVPVNGSYRISETFLASFEPEKSRSLSYLTGAMKTGLTACIEIVLTPEKKVVIVLHYFRNREKFVGYINICCKQPTENIAKNQSLVGIELQSNKTGSDTVNTVNNKKYGNKTAEEFEISQQNMEKQPEQQFAGYTERRKRKLNLTWLSNGLRSDFVFDL